MYFGFKLRIVNQFRHENIRSFCRMAALSLCQPLCAQALIVALQRMLRASEINQLTVEELKVEERRGNLIIYD